MNRLHLLSLGTVAGLALALGACAATPVYAPQASSSGAGYSEQQLDRTHYKVTFTGRRSTSRDNVEAGLLLRAAEVTRSAGYTHFLVDNRQTAQESRRGYVPGAWPLWDDPFFYRGRTGFGVGRWGLHDPFWYDYGWYDHDTRFVATADITVLNEADARNNPRAIEANDVIANLRPQLAPPPA